MSELLNCSSHLRPIQPIPFCLHCWDCQQAVYPTGYELRIVALLLVFVALPRLQMIVVSAVPCWAWAPWFTYCGFLFTIPYFAAVIS